MAPMVDVTGTAPREKVEAETEAARLPWGVLTLRWMVPSGRSGGGCGDGVEFGIVSRGGSAIVLLCCGLLDGSKRVLHSPDSFMVSVSAAVP